jgi:hypothetical protein
MHRVTLPSAASFSAIPPGPGPESRRFEHHVLVKQLQRGRYILPAFCSRQPLREFEHSLPSMEVTCANVNLN